MDEKGGIQSPLFLTPAVVDLLTDSQLTGGLNQGHALAQEYFSFP
jgi:hypothetical protein